MTGKFMRRYFTFKLFLFALAFSDTLCQFDFNKQT